MYIFFAINLLYLIMVHLGSEKSPKVSSIGPWGGNGGTNWDDGSHDGMRVITLRYGSCIDWIEVIYDNKNNPFPAPMHGGHGGVNTAQIVLRFPDEILTTVTGYYAVLPGSTTTPVIRSLMFMTNMGTYGPYGVEEGTPFSASIEGGKIVGFFGKSGWYLDAIGFYVEIAKKI
ncbi:hypothetical protein BUALT_Bualt02G0032400 [Buddleja alternifolia]|uniref:Jacalin-type lectin domain-containing protein n=1 Tax=Buddleja alternifolia TaxID=168488 RepID=A0AAV6XWY4_9LAMI|nr:hypothetical protein BUALT_Bualt02G0032400 [Buddleja alternifolia]